MFPQCLLSLWDVMYPVLLAQGRGRGRGRPRGGRTPTVRSVLQATMGTVDETIDWLPSIHLRWDAFSSAVWTASQCIAASSRPIQERPTTIRWEKTSSWLINRLHTDFPDQKSMWDEKYIIKDSLPPRPSRGRGLRGSRGGVRGNLTKRERNVSKKGMGSE